MRGGLNPNLPVRYGASFKSQNAAAGSETVVAAAANVNGLIVWAAAFVAGTAAGLNQTALLAKTSAPVSPVDGDAILTGDASSFNATGALYLNGGSLKRPVFVAAGKGLFFFNGTDNQSLKSVLYTLL